MPEFMDFIFNIYISHNDFHFTQPSFFVIWDENDK